MSPDDPGVQVAPGDPGQISQAAAAHAELANVLEYHAASVSGTASSVIGTWNGEAASSYQTLSALVANHYAAGAESASQVSAALHAYGLELQNCQEQGTHALHEAEHWIEEENSWASKLSAAQAAITTAQNAITVAQSSLTNPVTSGPFSPALDAGATTQLHQAQAALKLAQDQARTAAFQVKYCEEEVLRWQRRGRQAWDDALDAAQQATGMIGTVNVTPPPLAGVIVPDRFNDPPAPKPAHHSFFSLHTLETLGKDGVKLAFRGASTAVAVSPAGLLLEAASKVTGKTIGMCIGGNATGPDGLGVNGSVCFYGTPKGMPGVTYTVGGGAGTPGVGGSFGAVVSNGTHLSDQNGPFAAGEAGAGEGPYNASGTYATGVNAHGKRINDYGLAWTPSIGTPVAGHAGVTDTWSSGSFLP